ncbi:MAG: acyltransferase family protein [Hyphomonas sp.]
MKLHSIQILRGLAAFVVLAFHIRASEVQMIARAGNAEAPLVGGLFTNGFFGVDLFFVISGFIMVFVAGATPASPRAASEFLFARLTRIYPIWWFFAAVLAAYMIAAYGFYGLSEAGVPAIGRGIPQVEYLVKSFLLAPQPDFPVLGIGWTLVHEVHFYMVFALMLLAPPGLRPWLLAVWAALVTAGALMGLAAPLPGTFVQLATHPMTLEFILGAWAAYLVTSGRRWRPALVTAVAVFWLMFAVCYHGAPETITLTWGRVIWFGPPCALLVYGFASLDLEDRLGALVPPIVGAIVTAIVFQAYGLPYPGVDSVRLEASLVAVAAGVAVFLVLAGLGMLFGRRSSGLPAVLTVPARLAKSAGAALGDWSFSLYLSHVFVLHALQRIFQRLDDLPGGAGALFNVAATGRLGNVTFIVACIAGSTILAWLSYRFLELPMTRQFGKARRALFNKPELRVRPAPVQAAIW